MIAIQEHTCRIKHTGTQCMPFPFCQRTQTDLLAAPGQRPSSLPVPNSSNVHIGTGIDTHWCPSGRLHPQQWWRPGGSGRWPAGEVPARESCCRWCWHPEPPPRTGPCRRKRRCDTWAFTHTCTCQLLNMHAWLHTLTHEHRLRLSGEGLDWLTAVRLSRTRFNANCDWCTFYSEVKTVLCFIFIVLEGNHKHETHRKTC